MTALTPEIAADVVATCREGADEIVACLTRALDGEFVGVTIEETTTYDAAQPPANFDGAGLAIVFKFGETAAVALLPEASGLLPAWYAEPDPTGKSKLNTLAQELSMLLFPASLAADSFEAHHVDQLATVLARAEAATGATLVPLSLKRGEVQGQLSFLWPIAKSAELLAKPAVPTEPATKPASEKPAAAAQPAEPEATDGFANLPKHTRSLFKVQVPVSVMLATQKQSVHDIISLVPGAIIKFDKSCDEPLELMVGDQRIAAGEVVKVGDKFGLRIREMIQPQERFIAVKASFPA